MTPEDAKQRARELYEATFSTGLPVLKETWIDAIALALQSAATDGTRALQGALLEDLAYHAEQAKLWSDPEYGDEQHAAHHRQRVDVLRAALSSAPAEPSAGQWRDFPPEGPTSGLPPWDGKPVLICTDHTWANRVHRVVWTDAVHGHGIYGWAVEDLKHGPYALRGYMNALVWQPLPEPPR